MTSFSNQMNSKQPPRFWKYRHKNIRNCLQEQITFAVFSCLVTGLFGALISTPSNMAVKKGQEVAFSCSTNTMHKLLWYVLLPGATREELIFDGYEENRMMCFCSVQHANQLSTLYLTANESTAARYACTEMVNGTRAIAQLIVLDSEPVCSANSTEDVVSLKCIVNFSGHWSPVVEWTQIIGNEEEKAIDGIEATQTLDQFRRIVSIVSVLSVPANKSGVAFKFRVKFSSSNKPKETAVESIPTYNFSWAWSNEKNESNETSTEHGVPGDDASSSAAAVTGIVIGCAAVIIVAVVAVGVLVSKRKRSNLEVEVEVPLGDEGGKECAES